DLHSAERVPDIVRRFGARPARQLRLRLVCPQHATAVLVHPQRERQPGSELVHGFRLAWGDGLRRRDRLRLPSRSERIRAAAPQHLHTTAMTGFWSQKVSLFWIIPGGGAMNPHARQTQLKLLPG